MVDPGVCSRDACALDFVSRSVTLHHHHHSTHHLIGGSNVEQQGLLVNWHHEDRRRGEIALKGLESFLGFRCPLHRPRFLEQLEERQSLLPKP